MLKYLRELVPVKTGEGFITVLMFAYIFGVLTLYYILEPLRAGLFLKKVPSSQLPYMYFLIAFVAGGVAIVTFRLGRRLSAIAIMTGTNAVIFGTLFYFRVFMGRDIWYLPYVFYVYVKIVSVLTTAQFWLLAGFIYDNRQAKRIYSILGVGASLGAVAGSAIPAFLSKRLATESMLLVCMAVSAVLIVLSQIAWRHRRPDAGVEGKGAKDREKAAAPWSMILESRHLSLMVMLIFLTLITSQIADWQLMDAVQKRYRGTGSSDAISGFFGWFNLVTNFLTIVVQFLATGFVVNRLGVFSAIVSLPSLLLLSSFAIFLYPTLIAAAVARGTDTVSRYTLNRAGMEMLYLPLPPAVRKRLKLFLDVFVDRTGRAVAGVVILIFTSLYFPYGLRGTAAVAMVLTSICVLACIQLRKTYVQGFRQQLMRREIDLGDVSHFVGDPAAVRLLVAALESTNERQVVYALQLLQSVRNVDFSKQLLPLLAHASPHIREEAVHTLHALPGTYPGAAEELMADSAENVRVAAAEYFCTYGAGPTVASVRRRMAHDGAVAATMAAHLPAAEAAELLRELMEHPSPNVSAAGAIAAGRGGHIKLVFNVAGMLTNRRLRGAGRTALLCYGKRVAGTLEDLLTDTQCDIALRLEIPWVLARIPTRRSVDCLVDNLSAGDARLRFRIVKAMNRLRETNNDLNLPAAPIETAILDEARRHSETLAMSRAFPGHGILSRALAERLDERLEMIFRLLGLIYPQKEIYSCYLAIRENRPDRRTAAIELLDNILRNNVKPFILPILEGSTVPATARSDALRSLASQPDEWIAACARHENGETMTIIERVLLLQGIEPFSNVTTEQLSYVAAIAEETTVDPAAVLYRENDSSDGFYVVVSGTIAVTRGGEVIERIDAGGSFGVWALFDDQPRMTGAEAVSAAKLLFVRRDDFYDVLADHVGLVQGIFKQLVQRVRRLAAVAEQ